MANATFTKARQAFLAGDIDLEVDVVKAVLVDHDVDTPLPATDEFLSDILVGARVAISPALTAKTVTNGAFNAADVTLTSVTGATVESVVLFVDTGDPATSRLVLFIDTATGLTLTPNGGDVTLQWDEAPNFIFKWG